MAVLQISIPKALTAIAVDTDAVPLEVFQEAVAQGFKILLNRGQEKITKKLYPDAKEMAALALEKATEQFEKLMRGEFRASRTQTKSTLPAAVKTEAMRLARNEVKAGIKANGGKIGEYAASAITAAAQELLADPEQGPPLIELAQANLATTKTLKLSINVKAIPIDEKKVEKMAAEKAARAEAAAAKKAAKEATEGKRQPAAAKPKAAPKAPKAKTPTLHVGAMAGQQAAAEHATH
jgi:hypothetical protein